ncbi:hypothetical protein Q8A67_008632 [Cirrhinus molitorella]|uniref:Immunoglobulin V-set domain-containing protein n=1 Tax=Cirrhinus molitorella TaxID=172907 RepID=A0AA88TZB8_9TELE|nr:hypothetical protein Q8A67_008632 [Cirrhinus molitorella]
MALNHLLVSLIVLLTFKTVSFAEIQPKNLSVHAGDSYEFVQREKLPDFSLLMWIITPFSKNYSETIVTCDNETRTVDVSSSYKDRVVLNTATFSLTLKKMLKTDSGLYCTTTIGQKTIPVCQYNVSVVDNHGSTTTNFLPLILLTSTLSTIMF